MELTCLNSYENSVISIINEVFNDSNCVTVLKSYSIATIFLHLGGNHELIVLVKSGTMPS